ncbi:MAG: hypothetical protein GXZ19_11615 [Bacteroidales bacterium]|nr:hypothetical protein [Bacteroidales bacterium]
MREINLILFIGLLSFLFVQCDSKEKALYKKLEEMAANLNESTPVMLDQFTRFEEASVMEGNKFRYRYTVLNTSNADSLVEQGMHSLKRNIGKEFSSNPDLRIFKENNVVIEYVYNDESGRTIRSLLFVPEDYQ